MLSVSVIIPTHERRAFVREAVESVLAQHGCLVEGEPGGGAGATSGSLLPIEILVVDDGSRDGTAAALRAEFGARLRVIETPNRGVSAARNAGIARARGRWVAFLDSDDLWLPHKLAAQRGHLRAHPGAAICHAEEIWLRDGVRVNPRRHHAKPEGDIFAPSLERCLVGASTVLMRRDLFLRVGGFDESLPACEDYDLWLRLARTTPFALVREPLVVKRAGHGDQLSRRFWGMDRFRVAALRKLLAEPLTPEQRAATEAALARKCAVLAGGAAKRGRRGEAAELRSSAGPHA